MKKDNRDWNKQNNIRGLCVYGKYISFNGYLYEIDEIYNNDKVYVKRVPITYHNNDNDDTIYFDEDYSSDWSHSLKLKNCKNGIIGKYLYSDDFNTIKWEKIFTKVDVVECILK